MNWACIAYKNPVSCQTQTDAKKPIKYMEKLIHFVHKTQNPKL